MPVIGLLSSLGSTDRERIVPRSTMAFLRGPVAGHAADQIRDGYRCQDRQGARADDSAIGDPAGNSDYRVMRHAPCARHLRPALSCRCFARQVIRSDRRPSRTNAMKPFLKVAVVAGGYIAAFLMASAVVAIRVAGRQRDRLSPSRCRGAVPDPVPHRGSTRRAPHPCVGGKRERSGPMENRWCDRPPARSREMGGGTAVSPQ